MITFSFEVFIFSVIFLWLAIICATSFVIFINNIFSSEKITFKFSYVLYLNWMLLFHKQKLWLKFLYTPLEKIIDKNYKSKNYGIIIYPPLFVLLCVVTYISLFLYLLSRNMKYNVLLETLIKDFPWYKQNNLIVASIDAGGSGAVLFILIFFFGVSGMAVSAFKSFTIEKQHERLLSAIEKNNKETNIDNIKDILSSAKNYNDSIRQHERLRDTFVLKYLLDGNSGYQGSYKPIDITVSKLNINLNDSKFPNNIDVSVNIEYNSVE